MTHENTAPAKDEVDRIAMLMFNEWKRVDPCSGVANHPVSYMATFADMARVVLADLSPAVTVKPLEWHGEYNDMAPTQWGAYSIVDRTDDKGADCFGWSHTSRGDWDDSDDVWYDENAAKNAVQADLAQRISKHVAPTTTGEREAALREAAQAARNCGKPVGASDGSTFVPGTSTDAERAILALIDTPTPPAATTVDVSILPMKLSGGRTEHWVRIKCGDRTYDVRNYPGEYYNRALYERDSLRHTLLGEAKPDLMDERYADPNVPAASEPATTADTVSSKKAATQPEPTAQEAARVLYDDIVALVANYPAHAHGHLATEPHDVAEQVKNEILTGLRALAEQGEA